MPSVPLSPPPRRASSVRETQVASLQEQRTEGSFLHHPLCLLAAQKAVHVESSDIQQPAEEARAADGRLREEDPVIAQVLSQQPRIPRPVGSAEVARRLHIK